MRLLPGWRRKGGYVTLIVACLVFVAWVRSSVVYEVVGFVIGERQHLMISRNGDFSWLSWDIDKESPGEAWINFESGTIAARQFLVELRSVRQRHDCREWVIPWWTIVLALALLAASLILRTPRPND